MNRWKITRTSATRWQAVYADGSFLVAGSYDGIIQQIAEAHV